MKLLMKDLKDLRRVQMKSDADTVATVMLVMAAILVMLWLISNLL